MTRIADELGLENETVRNYFGGHNYKDGKSCGMHIEPGPDGGLVMLDDTQILDIALRIINEQQSWKGVIDFSKAVIFMYHCLFNWQNIVY